MEWRDIKGYEGLYQISDEGEVRSLNYNKTGRVQVLKPFFNGHIPYISLSKKGKSKTYQLGELTSSTFNDYFENSKLNELWRGIMKDGVNVHIYNKYNPEEEDEE